MLNHTDTELLRRFRLGETAAYNEIYERYSRKLFNYDFYRTRSKDLAYEIIQDVFVSLWSTYKTVEIKLSLSGYLYAMIRSRIFDLVRQSKLNNAYFKNYELFTSSAENYTEPV